jgi:hypothetical protein
MRFIPIPGPSFADMANSQDCATIHKIGAWASVLWLVLPVLMQALGALIVPSFEDWVKTAVEDALTFEVDGVVSTPPTQRYHPFRADCP